MSGGGQNENDSTVTLDQSIFDRPLEVDMKEVYKSFGRGSALGRQLYTMYNGRPKYTPTVKVKTKKSSFATPYEEHTAKIKERFANNKQLKANRQRSRRARLGYCPSEVHVRPRNSENPFGRPTSFGYRGKKSQSAIERQQQEHQLRQQQPHSRNTVQRAFGNRRERIRELQDAMSKPSSVPSHQQSTAKSLLGAGGSKRLNPQSNKRSDIEESLKTGSIPAKPLPERYRHGKVMHPSMLRFEEMKNRARVSREVRGPRKTPDEIRFDELVEQVSERYDFLDQMVSMGKSKQYEARIKGEIAQLVREMESLDKKMNGQ